MPMRSEDQCELSVGDHLVYVSVEDCYERTSAKSAKYTLNSYLNLKRLLMQPVVVHGSHRRILAIGKCSYISAPESLVRQD